MQRKSYKSQLANNMKQNTKEDIFFRMRRAILQVHPAESLEFRIFKNQSPYGRNLIASRKKFSRFRLSKKRTICKNIKVHENHSS